MDIGWDYSMTAEEDLANKLLNDMKMERVPIEKLVPNPKNPRIDLKPGMPLYEKLKTSIDHFNYMEPIVWNKRTGMIVAGHQRFAVIKAIAEERGIELKEVPVVVVDVEKQDEDAFMIASNKITGLWDQEKLAEIFGNMEEEWYRYTGFDDFEIETMLDDSEPQDEVDMDEEDEPIITHEKKPKLVVCPHCGKSFDPNEKKC